MYLEYVKSKQNPWRTCNNGEFFSLSSAGNLILSSKNVFAILRLVNELRISSSDNDAYI